MKKKKIIILSICSGVIILIICSFLLVFFLYEKFFSPFKTYEQKQMKGLYEYSVKEDNNIRLNSIAFIRGYPILFYHLKDYISADVFTDEELIEMKNSVERTLEYLNSDNCSVFYDKYEIAFHTGNGNGQKSIRFILLKGDDGYILESILSDWVCYLIQLNIFHDVQRIQYNGLVDLSEDYSILKDLKTLRELKISYQLDENGRKYIKEMIQTLLTNCNVIWEKPGFGQSINN